MATSKSRGGTSKVGTAGKAGTAGKGGTGKSPGPKAPDAKGAAEGSTKGAAAPRYPVLYSNPVPVDFSRHKGKSFKAPATFGYAAKTNSVPVNVIEFPVAALDYVLAFAPGSEPIPVAVLGLRTSENLFVDRDGRWDPHSYLPAYIRRYPFIFMSRPDQQLTLCIDETSETVVAGNERPLVVDGKASPQAEQALKFCQDYHSAGQQTHAFARKLVELDLLVDRAAAMDMGPDQRKISLGGLKVVSEARLGALDPATFAGLRERGFLTAIYAHLLSLNNLNKLGRRLNERLAAEKAAG